MLRIYPVILDWVASLRPVIRAVGGHDADLASQLRRSATSVCLNTAEGMGATGRSKRQCYRVALREMREALAAIDIAGRLGYVDLPDAAASDRQSHIVATLVRLAQL